MATLPSGLHEEIDDDEDLARFLVHRKHFISILVKPAAFLPNPNPKDRETSVSRHGATPTARLWKIGEAAAGDRTLYGAALFKAKNVREVRLAVSADEPPDRHAVIRGWPWIENDPQLQKAQQMELAATLAVAAGPPLLK